MRVPMFGAEFRLMENEFPQVIERLTRRCSGGSRSPATRAGRGFRPTPRLNLACGTPQMAAKTQVGRLYVGSSGYSQLSRELASAGRDAAARFLGLYAQRLPSVELNTTGYRLPG
jgi:hypothetical protein